MRPHPPSKSRCIENQEPLATLALGVAFAAQLRALDCHPFLGVAELGTSGCRFHTCIHLQALPTQKRFCDGVHWKLNDLFDEIDCDDLNLIFRNFLGTEKKIASSSSSSSAVYDLFREICTESGQIVK